MTKVAVGYVHNGMVHQPWMECLLACQTVDAGRHLEGTISAAGPYIANNRNLVVKRFLMESQADYLWFLDYDIIFAPEVLPILLSAAHPTAAPIVGGLYFGRFAEGIRSMWTVETEESRLTRVEYFTDRLQPLSAIGMGCTMIHRRVFQGMLEGNDDPWPWYRHSITPEGDERNSEDYHFCQEARRLGYPIWGVPVGLGHIKSTILDYDAYMKERASAVD
jgi:glycosyl transferase family 2